MVEAPNEAMMATNGMESVGCRECDDPYAAYGYTPLDQEGVANLDFAFAVANEGDDDFEEDRSGTSGRSADGDLADAIIGSLESEYQRTVDVTRGGGVVLGWACEPTPHWRASIEAAAKSVSSSEDVSVCDTSTGSGELTNCIDPPDAPMAAEHVESIKRVMAEMSLSTPPWEKKEIQKNVNEKGKTYQV